MRPRERAALGRDRARRGRGRRPGRPLASISTRWRSERPRSTQRPGAMSARTPRDDRLAEPHEPAVDVHDERRRVSGPSAGPPANATVTGSPPKSCASPHHHTGGKPSPQLRSTYAVAPSSVRSSPTVPSARARSTSGRQYWRRNGRCPAGPVPCHGRGHADRRRAGARRPPSRRHVARRRPRTRSPIRTPRRVGRRVVEDRRTPAARAARATPTSAQPGHTPHSTIAARPSGHVKRQNQPRAPGAAQLTRTPSRSPRARRARSRRGRRRARARRCRPRSRCGGP